MTTPIVVRTYKASNQAKAAKKFEADANRNQGYAPVSQSWAAPKFGAAGLNMALAGIFFLLGIFVGVPFLIVAFVFLVLAVVMPDSEGELTVTYQRT